MGSVYLIQPVELLNTSIYKIGCSKKLTLERCSKGYKKYSKFICTLGYSNPIELEKILKKNFKQKFRLAFGKEYFEGNERELLLSFFDIAFTNK